MAAAVSGKSAVSAIARIAQPWADVVMLIKASIQCPSPDVEVGMACDEAAHSLGGGDKADHPEVTAAGLSELRRGAVGTASGGQHGVDDDGYGVGRDGRKPEVVADGPRGGLVAANAEVTHERLGHDIKDAVAHRKASAEDGDDDWRREKAPRGRLFKRRHHGAVALREFAKGFNGQDGAHQPQQSPKLAGRSASVAEARDRFLH